jgi:hypothetical protein
MNEPEKYFKSINELKDGLGGWKIVSVSVNNHAVCFAHKLERITQDAIRITIMGHVKIKNNIPVSPDKWIYE